MRRCGEGKNVTQLCPYGENLEYSAAWEGLRCCFWRPFFDMIAQ